MRSTPTRVPAGAFRGYGLSQTVFAIESGMDALARQLGIDPFAFRRRNVVRAGERTHAVHPQPDDVQWGSYGLDQCLDAVEQALADAPPPPEAGWTIGTGMALAMIHTIPPRGHHAHSTLCLRPDGRFALTVGTAEFGNGTSTVHAQIAAAVLGVSPAAIVLARSDTDGGGHDTGAYGSTGTRGRRHRDPARGRGPARADGRAGRAHRRGPDRPHWPRRPRHAAASGGGAQTAPSARWPSTCRDSASR